MSTSSRPSAEEVQSSLNDLLIALIDSDDFMDRFHDIEMGEDGYPIEGAATIQEYTRCNDGNSLRVVLNVKVPRPEGQQKYEVFLCAHPNSLTCEEVAETLKEMEEHLKTHVQEESISSSDNDDEKQEEEEQSESESESDDDMDVDSDAKAKASNRPFKCNNCGFRFTQRWSLTRHLQSMPCKKVQSHVRLRDTEKRRRPPITSSRPECSYCGMKFTRTKDLTRHVRDNCKKRPGANKQLPVLEELACKHCGKVYMGARWLSRHIRNDCKKVPEGSGSAQG